MAATLTPRDGRDLAEAVARAAADRTPLEVVGGGTKRGIGHPVQAAATLDLTRLGGLAVYEPEELVFEAGPALRRDEAEAMLAARGQCFAFEPPDYSRLLGSGHAGTLGGMVAGNLSGPRRIKAGAARDHFLGFTAVSGQGETFKSGARVMKNVTGYDLPKLMAGSWGTLAALVSVTLKVLPAPQTEATVTLTGLDDADAVRAMAVAMASSCEVSGAAHLPAGLAEAAVPGAGTAVTLLRLEGVEPSVAVRAERLLGLLKPLGDTGRLDAAASRAAWTAVRDVHPLCDAPERLVWRVSVPPSEGARVLGAVRVSADARGFYDWAGGLVWIDVPASDHASAQTIRGAIEPATGHATLIRAPAAVRAGVAVFEPQPLALRALSARVKRALDPLGILNPGRIHAHF